MLYWHRILTFSLIGFSLRRYNFWPDSHLTDRQDIIMQNPVLVGIHGDKGISADSSKLLVSISKVGPDFLYKTSSGEILLYMKALNYFFVDSGWAKQADPQIPSYMTKKQAQLIINIRG